MSTAVWVTFSFSGFLSFLKVFYPRSLCCVFSTLHKYFPGSWLIRLVRGWLIADSLWTPTMLWSTHLFAPSTPCIAFRWSYRADISCSTIFSRHFKVFLRGISDIVDTGWPWICTFPYLPNLQTACDDCVSSMWLLLSFIA